MKDWFATESGHIAVLLVLTWTGVVMVALKLEGGAAVVTGSLGALYACLRGTGNGKPKEPTP